MALPVCQNILIFGGSFDPPHHAHVRLPRLAMHAVGADAVAYLPTGHQPLKTHLHPTPAHHRLTMLHLALQGEPWAVVLTDEIDRADRDGAPSYLVDTLESLRQRVGEDRQLRLLIGGDSLRTFDRWRAPDRIIALAPPVVMARAPDTRESLLAHLPKGVDAGQWQTWMLDLPAMDMSSTRVRQLVAQGQSIHGLVSPRVEEYIRQHRLYLSPGVDSATTRVRR